MFIVPIILGIFFIILIIISPFVFKKIFKTKICYGFCYGIICSFITNIILAIIVKIYETLSSRILLKDIVMQMYLCIYFVLPSAFYRFKEGTDFYHILYLISSFSFIFIILYFTIKKLLSQNDIKNIFIFCSGYILIPYSGSIGIIISVIINQSYDESISNEYLLLLVYNAFISILFLSSISIMIALHHKGYNYLIIIFCIGIFYYSFISNSVDIFMLKVHFFSYMNHLIPYISFSLAIFFYYEYVNKNQGSEEEYSNIEMCEKTKD